LKRELQIHFQHIYAGDVCTEAQLIEWSY